MSTPIGQLIRQARLAAGLTLEDVSARVGITPGALSHIESGRRLPYPQNAARIAEVLSLSTEEILAALDEAHSDRRQAAMYDDRTGGDALSAPSMNRAGLVPSSTHDAPASRPSSASSDRSSRTFYPRPIEELFSGSGSSRSSAPSPAPSLRQSARWSESTPERLQALDGLASSAAEAIRTLRGLLGDEDPTVAREARRLLRELDVRMPEEEE